MYFIPVMEKPDFRAIVSVYSKNFTVLLFLAMPAR